MTRSKDETPPSRILCCPCSFKDVTPRLVPIILVIGYSVNVSNRESSYYQSSVVRRRNRRKTLKNFDQIANCGIRAPSYWLEGKNFPVRCQLSSVTHFQNDFPTTFPIPPLLGSNFRDRGEVSQLQKRAVKTSSARLFTRRGHYRTNRAKGLGFSEWSGVHETA